MSPPAIPVFSTKPAMSKLEEMGLDLSNLIIDEAKGLTTLTKEFIETPAEPFNVEDYISFFPEAQDISGSLRSQNVSGDAVVADILDDV